MERRATHIVWSLGGENNGRNDVSFQLPPDEDDLRAAYNEESEMDYALQLSLLEEDHENLLSLIEQKTLRAQVEEDEQIAEALQHSLIIASSLSLDNTDQCECSSKPSRICGGCNSEITSRSGDDIIDCNGVDWHAKCLLCHGCRQVITDDELYMSENRPYHTSCHRKKRHPKCDVCNKFIPNTNDVVLFGEHPFWGQKYCPSHEHDATSKCCSCERLQAYKEKHTKLNDGRKSCSECYNFAIMDTEECQPLFHELQVFFQSLNLEVKQQIPLLLVEREALNEAMEENKNGNHHLSETRGLCLSEEQTISRRPKMRTGHGLFDMLTKPQKPLPYTEVTAILILYGLPRLLTGSVLAHEMMHAWIRLNGYTNLKPEVEEGICQVVAHMWLKSKLSSKSSRDIAAVSSSCSSSSFGRRSNQQKLTETERKLGECFIRQIEWDASSTYGDGFRVGHQAVSLYGLRATLDHIKLATTFPDS